MKAREAMLSAVQIYNNPLISFKTESFIVLSLIAWTYLLHAHYRAEGIDYRYFSKSGRRKKYVKNLDGSIKFWDMKECISKSDCPLDKGTTNNLNFLVGLRNQIIHSYDNISDENIWAIINKHIPLLKIEINKLIGNPDEPK